MSDFPEKPTAKDTKSGQAWRMPKIAAVATAVVLATGVVATQTFAGSWGGPGWRAGSFLNAPITQADADKRIKRIVRHMAIEVDATLEQQDQLVEVFSAASRDILPVRQQIKASRQAARTLLTQASIDRDAIETLRAEQVARLDKVSKRLAQAMADAADVLTPAQRARLSELMR